MDIETFTLYAGSYGARIERWPENTRTQAQQLLQTSPEAARVMREAAQLDGLLKPANRVAASANLRERVLAIPSMSKNAYIVWALRPYRPVWALAACALLGVMVGLSDGDTGRAEDHAAAIWGSEEPGELAI